MNTKKLSLASLTLKSLILHTVLMTFPIPGLLAR
jgi:hypothetical protein